MLIGVGLVVSLILLLAIPLDLTFQANRRDTLDGRIRLSWAFGMIRAQYRVGAPKHRHEPRDILPEATDNTGTDVIRAIFRPSLRRQLKVLLIDLWHAIKKRDIKIHLRIGLGDPADTGILWTVVGPLTAVGSNCGDLVLAVEPAFDDSVLQFEGSGSVRVVPLQVACIVLRFLMSPMMWKEISAMRGESR